MNALIKDILNIRNIFKLIKNPLLIKKVFKRLNYYPGLKFGYTNSKLYRKLEIFFTIFFAKKNNNFKKFFFNKNSIKIDKHYFEYNRSNILNEEQTNSLETNGILVLENVLDKSEFEKINDQINNLIIYNQKKNENEINLYKTSDLYKLSIEYELENNSHLFQISKEISKTVYGKEIKPATSIILIKVLDLPENNYYGDNTLHPDRYLPNLKMFYYNQDVDIHSAPFRFSPGSHKITDEYIDYFKNNPNLVFDQNNPGSKKFIKNAKSFPVKANSLIIAFTNGFHGRSKFTKLGQRVGIFFLYPEFDLKSLIFPYNK